MGRWLLPHPVLDEISVHVDWKSDDFSFILFLEKKKSLSTGCQGQLECVGRGTLFFSWLLWEQSRWGLLDDFRGHGWYTPAVDHVTRFTMGKAECFLCALGFPWPPASLSPIAVMCSHLIASS